ncbi:glutathione S-transferase P 1-like [Amphiura filiformis]|uniref:glutathione S-transferase P 1-like n=1 Tax=Amphiura filiformis TaxID=82378 RepID=UPI003B21F92A
MAETYKFIYFDLRGRGQAIRLLFEDQGLSYQEESVPVGAPRWTDELKPTLPFHQMPVFYDGDFMLVQSNTILRYLGRKHGLYGSTPQEAGYIDMVNDGVEDLYVAVCNLVYNKWENGKEDYCNKTIPLWMGFYENCLKKVNDGKSFIASEAISFADYNMFQVVDAHLKLLPTALDNFKVLRAWYDRIANRPGVAEFIKSAENQRRMVTGTPHL